MLLKNLLYDLLQNTRHPQGLGGAIILNGMNIFHEPLAHWGRAHVNPLTAGQILDIGCGGGRNLAAMLSMFPDVTATGLDYSAASVKKAAHLNRSAIAEGRCRVLEGDVSKLPFTDDVFSLATAFETVYFWPDLLHCFQQVLRVLQPGGEFMICNEASEADSKWTDIIKDMRVYSRKDLTELLLRAGFEDIKVDSSSQGWLCVCARKPTVQSMHTVTEDTH